MRRKHFHIDEDAYILLMVPASTPIDIGAIIIVQKSY